MGNYHLPLDPNLGSSETYGGSTVVYPPLANSTAIDHGDNTNATLTDQSGKARITDGDEDGISTIDIGAVEFKLVNHRPRITSTATPSVSENTTDVLTIVAIDSDLPAQVISFAITGGDDQSKFSITPTGILSFITPPVLSHPTDSNFDNVYIVQVTASDGQGGSTNQTLAVKVVDVTAPTLTQLSPPDNSDDVHKNSNLVLTFFEPVHLGTGNIVIRNGSDNSVFQTIDVVDVTRVAIGGSIVTVDPNDFDPGVSYYVEISPGAFKDLSGNSFAGIAGTTTWDFTVAKVALFDVSGTTLLLDLNSPNTNLSIMVDGSAYKLTLTGSYWSGTDSAAVVGNKTSTLTLTPTGLLNIDKIIIDDSAIGGSVTFTDSGTNAYTDDFSVILDQLGAGAIEFNGKTTFTGAKNLDVSTTSSIQLTNGSSLATASGNLTFKAAVVEANSTTIASQSGSITLNANSINFSGTTALQTTGVAVIAPLTAGTLINLGGTDAPGVLGLTDAELDRIATSSLTIGDPSSGTITVSAAITSDNQLSLINGDGGVLSVGGSLGTNGNSITLNTTGTIGVSSNRLLIADQPDVTRQKIIVGNSLSPNSIYLGGLGSLTLGNISGQPFNAKIDITAAQHLLVFADSTINSGTSSLGLRADTDASGVHDGIGTLTLTSGTSALGADKTLVGADLEIADSAVVDTAFGNTPTATLTGVSKPRALAVDVNGNLFVADYASTGRVFKFAPGTSTPSATLTGTNYPVALAFDTGGNLFVANEGNGTVSKYAPGTTTPVAVLTGLAAPTALAFDNSGSLFVVNRYANTVSKFAPGALTASETLIGLSSPGAIAIDNNGNVFVANFGSRTISKFSPGGTTASSILTGPIDPQALATDSSGNLYVANFDYDSVSKFAKGTTIPSSTLTGLNWPNALAIDENDNLFVSNSGNGTISRFSSGDLTASTILEGSNEPLDLVFGTNMAIDAYGNLFVANSSNSVNEFSPRVSSPSTVTILASTPSRTIDLGSNLPTSLGLTDAELDRIKAASISIGNENTSLITVTAPITLNASLNLTGSSILSGGGSLGTEGPSIILNATGSIGESSKRLRLAHQNNTAKQVVNVGTSASSSNVYLGSDGSLILGNFYGGEENTTIDVTAVSYLFVVPGALINSGTGNVKLSADTFTNDDGDGVGKLIVSADASVLGQNITLVGADVDIDSQATIRAASTVSIRVSRANQSLSLGGTLADSEIDRIIANTLSIGDLNSGITTFTGPLTPAAINTLIVSSNSDITQSFTGTALSGGADLVLNGKLSPALNGVGKFVVDGDTTFNAVAAFKTNLNGTNAYDQLIILGNNHSVNLGNATLIVTLDSLPSIGNVFKIIDSTGTGSSVIGNFTFNGVTINNGDTINVGNTHLRVDYNPALGPGDVTLTVVSQALLLSASHINENAGIGQTVGSLSLAEPFTGSTSFSLVPGVGASGNSNFLIDDNGNLKTSAAFNYEAQSSYSIRARATNSAGQTEQSFTISVIDLPELTGLPIIGNGTNQRSFVNKVTLLLDAPVTIDAGAFMLTKRDTGEVVITQATQSQTFSGQNQLTLTFSGSLTRGGGALSDGYYQLTIDGSKIRRGNSQADFNADGNGGDSLVIGAAESDNFFALYGDINGDGQVGIAEFGEFRAAFGKTSQDAGFNQLFDYEQDLAIGVGDFGQFRSRFGKAKLKF